MKSDELQGNEMKVVFIAMDAWNTNMNKIEIIYFYYIVI